MKRATNRRNTRDARGTVRITCVLLDEGKRKHQRGNIVRAFHMSEARVSEVARRIALLITGER